MEYAKNNMSLGVSKLARVDVLTVTLDFGETKASVPLEWKIVNSTPQKEQNRFAFNAKRTLVSLIMHVCKIESLDVKMKSTMSAKNVLAHLN